jgi:DNA-directed RNA polymerase specialized sigma24 family protein
VSNDISFDDGVSAISQDTLEQMARVYPGESEFLERVHSDVTQDPVDTPDESWMHTVNPNRQGSPFRQGQRISSPLRFTRQGRSGEGTINTKHSRQTIGTKSTMSTQTHEFASAFRKDEQKFWQDVVNEQDEREDPADGSIGISSRHEKLIRARELRRIREMVSYLPSAFQSAFIVPTLRVLTFA